MQSRNLADINRSIFTAITTMPDLEHVAESEDDVNGRPALEAYQSEFKDYPFPEWKEQLPYFMDLKRLKKERTDLAARVPSRKERKKYEMKLQYLDEKITDLRKTIAQWYLRFVYKTASKLKLSEKASLEEMIADGNVGLMRAVDHYNPHLGNRFTTYAKWWINQSVIRGLAGKFMIHLPMNKQIHLRKAIRYMEEFKGENGRYPTHTELKRKGYGNIVKYLSRMEDPTSLDAPVASEDGEIPYLSMIGDLNSDFREKVNNILSMREVLAMVQSPRARRILELRYGIDGKGEKSLDYIAETMDISRERVRQLQHQTLKKLRRIMAMPPYLRNGRNGSDVPSNNS